MHLGAGIPVCSDCRERLSMLFFLECVCVLVGGGGEGMNIMMIWRIGHGP